MFYLPQRVFRNPHVEWNRYDGLIARRSEPLVSGTSSQIGIESSGSGSLLSRNSLPGTANLPDTKER